MAPRALFDFQLSTCLLLMFGFALVGKFHVGSEEVGVNKRRNGGCGDLC